MLAHIHLGKGASVSHTHHLHCKVAEEVDDLQSFGPQTENENQGRHNGTKQLFQNEHL